MKFLTAILIITGIGLGSASGYYGKQYLDDQGTRECVYNKTNTTGATKQNGTPDGSDNYAKQEIEVFSVTGKCEFVFEEIYNVE